MRTGQPARPQERERPTSAPLGAPVTPSELVAQHLGGATARAVSDHRRPLVVRGVTVAFVGTDPAAITPMCVVSARDLPVVDILAALAAQDPTGVLVIEAGDDAFSFEVIRGRLTGARGTGPLDKLESFVADVHRKQPDRFGPNPDFAPTAPAWMQVARAFVEERVLDQLRLCSVPGARMTLIRGDIEWIGTRLPDGVGPTLAHALLEHARRCDETPRILATLGSLDRVAMPIGEPAKNPVRPEKARGAGESWDFFDDPDPAALAEWEDVRRVFSACDGESTLAEIIENAMLGDFRGALALHTLVTAKCIVLLDPERARIEVAESSPGAAVIQMRPHGTDAAARGPSAPVDVPSDIDTIDGDPEQSGTGYSMVIKKVRPRRRPVATEAPRPPKLYFEREPDVRVVEVVHPSSSSSSSSSGSVSGSIDTTGASPSSPVMRTSTLAEQAEAPTRREVIEATIVHEDPAERSMLGDRSVAAGRVMDRMLPSPRAMMIVLGTTGGVALLAAALAMI